MSYKVYSEKEIKEMNLIPKGSILMNEILPSGKRGAGEVITEATISNNNNAMIRVVNAIYNDNGKKITTIVDHITPGTKYGDQKLFSFCKSLDILEAYETGDLNKVAQAAIGKTGLASIGIQKGEGEYPDSNTIGMYVTNVDSKTLEKKAVEIDDNVPF